MTITKRYLTEMHMHTDESSNCSHAPAAESIELYIRAGYDSVVITDHFQLGDGSLSRREYSKKADVLRRGWHSASEAARGRINVLRGMEIRLRGSGNDYLIYGVTEEFILGNPDIRLLDIGELCPLVHESGLMIFQAHPFRTGMTITDPALLDGVEVFNGNINHDSRNGIALSWARLHSLREVSGSDYHQLTDIPCGGILTDEPIRDSAALLRVLSTGGYGLIKPSPATRA